MFPGSSGPSLSIVPGCDLGTKNTVGSGMLAHLGLYDRALQGSQVFYLLFILVRACKALSVWIKGCFRIRTHFCSSEDLENGSFP